MKSTLKLAILAILCGIGLSGYSQCTFTGLQSAYCPTSSAVTLSPATSNPNGYFYGGGMAGSVFTPSLAAAGVNTISYAICSGNYSITAGTFSPATYAGSVVSLADDEVSSARAIGFTFKFFCNNYTQFYISSNGFITFNVNNYTNNDNGCCQGLALPTNAAPDDMIAVCWTDLHPPSSSGAITHTTLGTAPNRRCVVTYSNINHYNSSSYCCPITTQIILYETTNVIEIHSATIPLPTSTYDRTMGLQNLGATVGFPVANRNASSTWTATNEMYRWTPQAGCVSSQTTLVSPSTLSITGASSLCIGSTATLNASGSSVTYTWSNASNNSSIVVNPATTTTYSVSGTNGSGCIASGAITVTVFPGSPTLAISSSTNPTCPGKSTTLTATGAPNYSWTGGITNAQGFTLSTTTTFTVTGFNACGSSTAAITLSVQPIQIAVLSSPTTVCAGQAATLSAASAGTSYVWMPYNFTGGSVVVTPSATTIFTVTTTDGTCTGTQTLALNTNPVPTITAMASASMICEGASVTFTASGASGYSWTPGSMTGPVITVSPTAPTLYSVTGVNSFSCYSGITLPVIVYPSPTLVVTAQDPLICSGSSATLSVTGGSTYLWTSSGTGSVEIVSPTSTTVYSVTGTSQTNSCTSTATIEVDVFTPNVAITGNTVICAGATTSLNGSGANTYTWNPGASPFQVLAVSPASTTIYTLSSITQTGNLNCAGTNTVQVTVNPNPTVTASTTHSAICKGESVVLSVSGASTYSWSNAATTTTIALTPTVITTINYSVTGTNSLGCSSVANVQVKVNACNSIGEVSGQAISLSVYPNPNSGEFAVKFTGSIKLSLVNELGQVVKSLSLDESNSYSVTVSGLASGVYFIQGEKGDSRINQKIIVTR